MINLAKMVQNATASYAPHAGFGVNRIKLANGGTLICSVKNRASNSRGANRGRHLATTWHYRAPAEQYSKQCSAQAAKDLLEQHGEA